MVLSPLRIKSICRLLVGLLFLTQFAVASYACARLSGMGALADCMKTVTAAVAGPEEAILATTSGMSTDCDQVDQDAGNLCVEHCRYGQQSVDSAPAPVVHAAMPTLLYALPPQPVQAPGFGRSFPAADANVAVAHPPPHAILHCVFRI